MKIYRAETGQQVPWPPNKKSLNSVKDLKVEIEKCIGVPVYSQILMTSFGTQVKESNLHDILNAKDKDEYILFCYDRQYLDALPEEISNLLDVETPQLEPKVPPFTGEDSLRSVEKAIKKQTISQNCETYLSLFKTFDDYSQMLIKISNTHAQLGKSLVEEQRLQRMALNVAMTNLETHNKTMDINVRRFIAVAEKEQARQNELVESLSADLEILKHVKIHPSFQLTQKMRLVDWVDLEHIESVRQETVQLCVLLSQETQDLLSKATELAQCEKEVLADIANKNQLHNLDSILADVQETLQRAQYLKDTRKRDRSRVSDKIAELLHRPVTEHLSSLSIQPDSHDKTRTTDAFQSDPQEAKKTFILFHHLAEYQVQHYLPQLANYEQAIRQKVSTLALSKRTSIQELIKYMNAVSQIQSEIASVEPRLKDANDSLDEFKRKYGQNDLGSVRDILFGYGALIIEIVRRREYSQIVSENGLLLSDLMSKYKLEELKRRDFFNQEVANIIPFKPSMEESCPQYVVTPPNRSLSIQDIPIQKKDITDFISLLGQAYGQSTSTSIRSTSPSIRRLITQKSSEDGKFHSILKVMYQQLDLIKIEFLKSMEEDFFPSSVDSPKMHQAAKKEQEVDSLLNDERRFYEARIQMLERQLENSHERDLKLESDSQIDPQKKEIEMLKETIQKMEREKIESDQEKEDLRLQIHELEQVLEEEKQAYEHNRQSLMNEAKIKDNLAEIRIAGLEEDWQEKLEGLQKAIAREKETVNELRQKQPSEADRSWTEKLERVENEKIELEKLISSLRKDLESVNQRLNEEKTSYEERLSELQLEMTESERARDEIKSLQQQTRLMVNRAQDDWVMKHEELTKIKDEQAKVKVAISGLLSRYMGEGAHITEQSDLEPIIRVFQHNLDHFTAQANLNQENYENLEQEAAGVSRKYDELLETHEEWRPIAIGMAEKLEEFRKMALYELINQFQISADEDELNILSKKVTPSEDDAAMWNEILQLASSIDLKSITQRLYKRTKDVVEQAKRYKKEYRELKDKNMRLSIKLSEKISFRNFKVGDVALFLPTRSSGGKPWAAFNIGSPYYFLSPEGAIEFTAINSEWIVARITHMIEHVVDENDPNPYGLSQQVKYYELQVEDWRNQRMQRKRSAPTASYVDSGLASITSPVLEKRPSFASLASSSNIVHSTSPHHDALKRRRSSTSIAMIPQ